MIGAALNRDGRPVTGAVIVESAVDMALSGMPEMKGSVTLADIDAAGLYRFRARAGTAGYWALHLAARVPGEVRTERTYFPTAKYTYVRTLRGEPEIVRGAVTFGAK